MGGSKSSDGSKSISANYRAPLVPLLARIATQLSRGHAGEIPETSWTCVSQSVQILTKQISIGVAQALHTGNVEQLPAIFTAEEECLHITSCFKPTRDGRSPAFGYPYPTVIASCQTLPRMV